MIYFQIFTTFRYKSLKNSDRTRIHARGDLQERHTWPSGRLITYRAPASPAKRQAYNLSDTVPGQATASFGGDTEVA